MHSWRTWFEPIDTPIDKDEPCPLLTSDMITNSRLVHTWLQHPSTSKVPNILKATLRACSLQVIADLTGRGGPDYNAVDLVVVGYLHACKSDASTNDSGSEAWRKLNAAFKVATTTACPSSLMDGSLIWSHLLTDDLVRQSD